MDIVGKEAISVDVGQRLRELRANYPALKGERFIYVDW